MRWLVVFASLVLAGCGFGLDEGTYRFTLQGVEEDSCGRGLFLPDEWEGIVKLRSRTVQMKLADPFFLTSVGGRTLVGRGFPERDPEALLVDTSFPDVVPFPDVDCPAFTHLQVEAEVQGDTAFSGLMSQVILVEPQAPASCPVQCVTAFLFEARKVSDRTDFPLDAP